MHCPVSPRDSGSTVSLDTSGSVRDKAGLKLQATDRLTPVPVEERPGPGEMGERGGWKADRQMAPLACLPPHTAQREHLVSRAESEELGKLLREKHLSSTLLV